MRKNGMMKMRDDEYVIGSGTPPSWCSNRITPFRRMNGTIGYEFAGVRETFILEAGEVLVKNGREIEIPNIREKRELTK